MQLSGHGIALLLVLLSLAISPSPLVAHSANATNGALPVIADAPSRPSLMQWQAYSTPKKERLFNNCVEEQMHRVLRTPETETDVQAMRARVLERVLTLGKRVVVVVFFGRRRYVRILVHYLLRNLRGSGGVVDSIWLYMNTRSDEDVQFAKELRANSSAVRLVRLPASLATADSFCNNLKLERCKKSIQMRLNNCWNYLRQQKGTLYLRVDDDVLFLEDGAFEHLLYQKLFNPGYVLYSGNMINSYQV